MASRSVKVTLENDTAYNLLLVNKSLSHGEWTDFRQPPEEILSGDTADWQSESAGILTGTEGKVTYRIDMNEYAHSSNPPEAIITWDDPYSGSNGCSMPLQGEGSDRFTATVPEKATISGDNATMNFKLS
ncbi:hypothetical protein D3C79_140590 [compost metagenome]